MATSSDFTLMKLTKLNDSNWAFSMRVYLESFDLFKHVDGSAVPPEEDATANVKESFRLAAKKAWT